MTSTRRLLAAAGAVALVAASALVGVSSPAHAAGQTMTVTPNTNLKGGDVVTVSVTGFSPNAPVAIGVCPTGRKVTGPGDCGRSKDGASKLTTADASGKSTAQITIPEGALGNSSPPAAKCPPCTMGATNIAKATETVTVDLKYASSGGGSSPTPTPTTTTKPKPPLAPTGAREAFITGLAGVALLQVGLIFSVRAARSGGRRSHV